MLINKTRSHKRQTSKRKNKVNLLPNLPNFGPLFLGILIGIFIASLVVFTFATSDITLKIPLGRQKKATEHAVSINIAKEAVAPSTEPRFDFYTELAKNNHESAPNLKSTTSPINEYLVQVGSYNNKLAADALRAELTLNGYVAKVIVNGHDEAIKHTVVLGPYKNKEQAQKLQQELKLLAIKSNLVLKNME